MIKHADIITLPPVSWGADSFRDIVVLELTTPEGVSGLGSAYTGARQVQDAFDCFQQNPAVLDSADAEMTIPMSAFDTALWDIKGKEQNLSVSELLGGRQRERVLGYATVDLPTEDHALEQALRSVMDQGFKAIKIGIEGLGHRDNSKSDIEWDRFEAQLLRRARSVAGSGIRLMLDVWGSDPDWTADYDWAFNTAKVLEELDYFWFEEPLAPHATDDFSRLTRETSINIAGGEDFVMLEDFKTLTQSGALNVIQPDGTRVGGLTKMQAIRDFAAENGIHLVPHGWNSAVGLAADIQIQSTMTDPTFCMVEVMPQPIMMNLLQHDPFAIDNEGKIRVPTGPGLGVELNEKYREDTLRIIV